MVSNYQNKYEDAEEIGKETQVLVVNHLHHETNIYQYIIPIVFFLLVTNKFINLKTEIKHDTKKTNKHTNHVGIRVICQTQTTKGITHHNTKRNNPLYPLFGQNLINSFSTVSTSN